MIIKKSIFVLILSLIICVPLRAQEQDLKREVTLYNPYKPSLSDARKLSFLPDINDTASVNPVFSYDVNSEAFNPTHSISPIKSASLLSDPLPKLYKSYVRLGLGNNSTPLGELSISNHRSKKGAAGIYAKHYSSNGKVPLENKQKVYAGFMDNDATVYGRKFFDKSYVDLTADFMQKVRYAYGYNTETPYEFLKKNIRLSYIDAGASLSFVSLNLDSADLSYDLGVSYDYFRNAGDGNMNHVGFNGKMAALYKGFYLGGGLDIDHYTLSKSLGIDPKYILTFSPFVKKSTDQWNFHLGAGLSLEKNLDSKVKAYIHPDLEFGFSVVPQYVRFFAELGGRLENNEPMNIIRENPFLLPGRPIYCIPNTNHAIVISAGLKGNSGIGGNYVLSASYSIVNKMIFYSNIFYPPTSGMDQRGNYFTIQPDDAEVFNVHGELSGKFSKRMSFNSSVDYYKYTLSANQYAWNKPDWKGRMGLFYNLRDKIIAGAEVTALGSRKLLVGQLAMIPVGGGVTPDSRVIEQPVHVNLGLSAEYRYTRILSFWVKVDNVSWNRYYEWAFYPSQMFNIMAGFSYSL
ncbi:MAG TPA: hypothetical protein PK727_07640 [Bacteroidales bacterium]|jgi:hypothetical protein|nr:hypothetical protein [Bacteroidales bacterium]HNY53324.1 hypothetical protein [Bacteroidales bacterium]HOG57190.1 hypothetical protein [Bacteroidales bacterium]HPB13328.1 hypothetical protein [Bacteroidales bacterium]HPV16399.1 hypothetical protein [Bacteroidales bacterium]